jgi:hypothetical protein
MQLVDCRAQLKGRALAVLVWPPALEQRLNRGVVVLPNPADEIAVAVERVLVVALDSAPERLALEPIGAGLDRLLPGEREPSSRSRAS